MSVRLCAVFLSAALIGCGASYSANTPEEALASFARALRNRDAAAAYALTSDSYRARISREDFERWFRMYPEEIRQAAEQLDRPAGPAEQEAIVEVGEHERVRLVRDPAGWRVATDVVDYYGQSTPRQALRTFVRAFEHRRYDIVLRLVPEGDRADMTEESVRERWEGEGREEVERMIAGIRTALDADAAIEETGDHAVMPWGERYRAQLVREDGVWRIEDPD